MAQTHWTLETPAGEKTFADLGLSSPRVTLRNQSPDTFTVSANGAACDDAPIVNYLDNVILRAGRQRATPDDPWFGGRVVFQGRFVNPEHLGSGRAESISYEFTGPWDYFDKHKFIQRWIHAHPAVT